MMTTDFEDLDREIVDLESKIECLEKELAEQELLIKKIESRKLSIINNKHNNWEVLDNGTCIAFDRTLKGVLGKI